MKNEEKAKEIAHYNCTHICLADCSAESYFSSENDCYKAAMKMAEWKEQQMIENACDAYCRICDTHECFNDGNCNWVERFRKAIKE